MKWWQETTVWTGKVPNHIYLLNDSKSKMYAFKSCRTNEIKIFKNPIRIETRGRKFVLNRDQFDIQINDDEPQGRVWQVKGSKGDEYNVSEVNGEYSCTCAGYKFRGTCKHIDSVR